MFVARRYVVRGRVQGVGFRFYVEHAARVEGITGWVGNRSDGAVEVHAEGDAEAVSRFEARLHQGPPAARVDRVTIDEDVPAERRLGFARRDQI